MMRVFSVTLCMLSNFSFFCHLLIFFKINFFEKKFGNTIRVLNSLYPYQVRHFVYESYHQTRLVLEFWEIVGFDAIPW